MPSLEREASSDRDLFLKSQSSFADGRASVPIQRWDSSDPERAPPPLPLNPGSSSPATRPSASKNIAAAAEALTAKARDNTYTSNSLPQKSVSPEKSLIRSQHHRRLQSLQPSAQGEKHSYTDALSSLNRSPERSPERLSRPQSSSNENKARGDSVSRSGSPTPVGKENGRETFTMRPSRPPLRPILGENSPTSSTMLAIQNMVTPKDNDASLADITNGSNPSLRNPQSFDAISSQIVGLTTIATNLQREMAQLSRRSKDNATDLVSLKEATNSRDEDIRQSLKELVTNISTKMLDPPADTSSRMASSYHRVPGPLFLDNKAYNSPSSGPRGSPFNRVASPSLFTEADLSSNTHSMECAASIALLEKIWRDMGTKEGQEKLLSVIADYQDQPMSKQADPVVTRKLEEIHHLLKENYRDNISNRALVPRRDNGNRVASGAPKVELDFDPKPAPLATASRELTPKRETPKASQPSAAAFINEDLQKMLKKMKDSISEGGGMTAEVKAHVRELRGEVLGMGRDIARRLEQAESTSKDGRGDAQGPGREEIASIVQDGLAEMREHMENMMRERRRQSSSSIASKNIVDGEEIYAAVKNALAEYPQQQVATQHQSTGIEREDILEAVREAWETYKPEIELQNFGLERDEILECLKEGLQQHRDPEERRELGGATYEEVLDAVREGLEHFKPPTPLENEASITREEILMTVRDCLDSYEFPASAVGATREPEMTREDVLEAVKEGLSQQPPISKDIEFNREDLFEAVKAGLDDTRAPMGGVGDKVMEKMEELIDDMRVEFKQYSVANGGDTEQVLDAMKDGLEVLRADIEAYVDRTADVTGKDEIIDTVRHDLDHLRTDLETNLAAKINMPDPTNNGELLDAMEKEFEHLRQTIATSMLRSGGNNLERDEILEVIRDGLDGSKATLLRDPNLDSNANNLAFMKGEFEHLKESLVAILVHNEGTASKGDILDAIRESHENLRSEMGTRLDRPESIISGTGELLDAFNDGLDALRVDIEKMVNRPLDMTVNYEILETLKEGLVNVRADIDRLHANQAGSREASNARNGEVVIADENVSSARGLDMGRLEMMITQLRIKVEALDNMAPPISVPQANSVTREHVTGLEAMLREVQISLAEVAQGGTHHTDNVATKDDIDAVETLLRNTKAKIDEFSSSDVEGLAKIAHYDSMEAILNETRDAVYEINAGGTLKKDVGVIEAILQEVRVGVEELREKESRLNDEERITRTDIEALESLCMDTKTHLSELVVPDPETTVTKSEVSVVAELVRELGERITDEQNLIAQAFDARKTEHGGIADKVEDVKLIMEDVRDELKVKINENSHSIMDVASVLEAAAESISAADVTTSVHELRESIRADFKTLHDASDNAKAYHEGNHSTILGKHENYKNAVIEDINARIDARFDELMTKYDDAQLASLGKEQAMASKDTEQSAALDATKTIADDLRLLVDTLGSTITESCDHMSEDSKTVYTRIEEVASKIDELIAFDVAAEHQNTRAHISTTLAGVEGIQAHASEYHPKILSAINDLLHMVGQHYEHAQTSNRELKENIQAIPSAIPLPAIAPPQPTSDIVRDVPVTHAYDDSHLHSKLDQLLTHTADTGKVAAELGMLETIREQVATSSTLLESLVVAQKAAVTENEKIQEQEAERAAIALEKRTAQKEIVEADIVRLSSDKTTLDQEVQSLHAEKEELVAHKSKLQADLSSLETALQIRREELQIMEARAEGLERRILDGVLDHSRSLLTTSRPQSSLKEMNLKRVTSISSNITGPMRATSITTATPNTSTSALSSGIGMALKRRQPPRASTANAAASKADRRILSLSTLSANKGVPNDRSMMLVQPTLVAGHPKSNAFRDSGMKRSHSVKSNFPARKTSWGGTKALGMYADDEVSEAGDKENSVLDEADEECLDGSETGTERRTSYSGTYTGTGSYGDGSMTSYSDDKRLSFATSTVGTIGTRDFAITEDGHSDDDERLDHERSLSKQELHHGLVLTKEASQNHDRSDPLLAKDGLGGNASEMVVYGHNSDSGIGTDIPTANLEGGNDYFVRE